jgi:hypothetical protein
MNGGNRAARVLVILGGVVLFLSVALHTFAAQKVAFPALAASNLPPALQAGLRVVFVAAGWHWLVIGILALIGLFARSRAGKMIVLVSGLALLLEAVAGALAMGLFIGNEMIGGAGLLILLGALLLKPLA